MSDKGKDKQEPMPCRECEGLYLQPPGCDYTVSFSNPDCLNCSVDNEKSRQKKLEKRGEMVRAGRDFEFIVTQEFLDILNGAGSTLLPLDYRIGDVVMCRIFEQPQTATAAVMLEQYKHWKDSGGEF